MEDTLQSMDYDEKGQLIITDLILYVIILMVVLSFIIYLTDYINSSNVSKLSGDEINQLLDNTMDVLVHSPGDPYNWNYLSNSKIKTVGLQNPNSNLTSYDKLLKIKNDNSLIDNMLPENLDYSILLLSANGTNQILLAGGVVNSSNIYTKSETIIIDYGYTTTYINSMNNDCSYQHDDICSCSVVNINKTQLDTSKYYIVTSNDAKYLIQNSYNETITGETNDHTSCINEYLEELLHSEEDSFYIHVMDNGSDTFLVEDQNDRSEYLYSVIEPELYIISMSIYA